MTALLTERLELRQFDDSDAERLACLAGDWDVASMTINIPHPYRTSDALMWLQRTARQIDDGLLRRYALVLRRPDNLIGCMTLKKKHRNENEAELSYWLGKPYWGNGLTREAASRVLRDGMATFQVSKLRAAAKPTNLRSIRVLEKIGFSQIGVMHVGTPRGDDVVELLRYRLTLSV
jgi:RimJ/RimL family protein N-acetyltransferase